ncbi:unnamed protein product [Caenorhabditis brenneri]
MRVYYQLILSNELHHANQQELLENFYLDTISRAAFEEEVREIVGSSKPVVLLYDLFYLGEIDLQRMEHRNFLIFESNDAIICSSIPNAVDGFQTARRAIYRELEFPSTDPE